MSVEDIFFDINKYIETKIEMNTDVLFIDGTKYEANANKNTFIWRKNNNTSSIFFPIHFFFLIYV